MHFLPLLTRIGSVAEWSKALVLGTSLQGGVGSNPTTANILQNLAMGCCGVVVITSA